MATKLVSRRVFTVVVLCGLVLGMIGCGPIDILSVLFRGGGGGSGTSAFDTFPTTIYTPSLPNYGLGTSYNNFGTGIGSGLGSVSGLGAGIVSGLSTGL